MTPLLAAALTATTGLWLADTEGSSDQRVFLHRYIQSLQLSAWNELSILAVSVPPQDEGSKPGDGVHTPPLKKLAVVMLALGKKNDTPIDADSAVDLGILKKTRKEPVIVKGETFDFSDGSAHTLYVTDQTETDKPENKITLIMEITAKNGEIYTYVTHPSGQLTKATKIAKDKVTDIFSAPKTLEAFNEEKKLYRIRVAGEGNEKKDIQK